MLALRPTFSESWYRVKDLRVRLRPSAQVSRQFYRGERWYVMRDPAGNQFHRLSDAAYRFIGLLDGTRSVEEAWDLVGGQLADDAPTQPEVIQILSQLYAANLIETNITPDATVLLRRHKQMQKSKFQNRLMNVLFPRIPLWDPDRFLVRWMPVVGKMISKVGALIWLVVIGLAIVKLVPMWPELKTGAADAVAPGNWFYLWAVFVLIKFIHELGHAFSCRRFGGECHEVGIMFLVAIPTPYVDASSAWAFSNKWQRVFVGAAGMIIELFVAAILAVVWANTKEHTLVHQLSFNAMLIASVSTLVFNANPLLRYDGYYILSDYLEIPNLRQKSTEYALGLIKRHVFRIKARQPLPPPGQRVSLFLYAVSSSIYRVMVGFFIIILVAYQIPVLGVLMAIGGVVTWLVTPIFQVVKYLMLEPELHRKRGRAGAFAGAVALAVLVLIGLVPFNVYVRADGVVEPLNQELLHAGESGFITQIAAHDGQDLKKGDAIVVASDPALNMKIAQLRATLRALEAQRLQSMSKDQSQRVIDEIQIKARTQELNDSLDRQKKLTLTAPFDGRLVAPNLKDIQGKFVKRGEEICTIATIDKLLVRTAVEQMDAGLMTDAAERSKTKPNKAGKNALYSEIRLAGDVDNVLHGQGQIDNGTVLVPEMQVNAAHPMLTHMGGGEIPVDPKDPNGRRTLTGVFEVRVNLANPKNLYFPGQRASVRFELDKKPLIWQWARSFLQMIQTHSDSKWL